MIDALLHFQMERALQPAFDRLRLAAMEFAESIPDLEKMIEDALPDDA